MSKGPDAFRTISEVADWLEVPTHVLRFWESRFSQVKPVKRAGGRRYYRPADMQLLGGIKRLLHDEGLTIRGVQKLLREEGVRHVAALSPPIDGEAWDPSSAKVITLNPVRPEATVTAPPDRWPFTDDAEQAVETLAAYLAEDDAPPPEQAGAPAANDDAPFPSAAERASGRDRAEAPEEAAPEAAVESRQSQDAPDTADQSPAAPDEGPAAPEAPAAQQPVHDESTAVAPPLVIAPLLAIGRAARLRKARALSSAVVEAELLARSWDARA